jgi:dTDP-4-dehydrorhamnose reductase
LNTSNGPGVRLRIRSRANGLKVLVLGGAGMLGHKVVQRLSKAPCELRWTLHGVRDDPALDPVPMLRDERAIERFDAMNSDLVESTLRSLEPTVVVNCLGLIKQRSDASAAIPSITLNSLLPHRVAELLTGWGGRLIHFSTDCVFSGRRGDYTEDDVSDAEDLYGRSKFLGEVTTGNALTLRTSIIGRELRHRQSLLDWFLAQNGQEVRGYRRVWWSGVTTNHLADLVAWIIETRSALYGLFQVSSGKISKYDLLVMIRERYGLDIEIIPDDNVSCDRSMIGRLFERTADYVCPTWPVLLDQLVSDATPYPDPP